MNHSFTNNIIGEYAIPPPIEYKTPWKSIKCQILVAKELIAREVHIMRIPTYVQGRRACGHRVRAAKIKGAPRYRTP
jgi:hypothetical protein